MYIKFEKRSILKFTCFQNVVQTVIKVSDVSRG